MYTQKEFFIGGKWAAAEGTDIVTVIDPDSEEVSGTYVDGTRADIDHAVSAARQAFDKGPWPKMSHAERAEVLRKAANNLKKYNDEMADALTAEMGSPISQSRGAQIPVAIDLFEYYAGLGESYEWTTRRPTYDAANADYDIIVRHEPVGVVAAIIPWNGPQIVAAMKLGPALIAGCTAVLKPSPEASFNFIGFAKAFQEAGLPEGVLNIVTAGREVGEYLVTHDGVDKVTFTGSTAAGRRIGALCGERIRRCSLELGGKSAAIILPDADFEATAQGLLGSMMFISGQACNALTRILAPKSHYEEVVAALEAAVSAAPLGSSYDPNTFIGPLASAAQRDRVEGYIGLGKQEGANVVMGGGRPKGHDKGWFVEKTIFRDVDNSMRIAQEEIFGPVYAVIKYEDTQDAINIANDSDYGLAGAVYTRDEAAGLDVISQIRAGSTGVNFYSLDCAAPFGGFKNSGIGRERGPEAIHYYTETKSVLINKNFKG